MNIIHGTWIIYEQLTLRQEEILFITLQSAGIAIHPTYNKEVFRISHPYIIKDEIDVFRTSQLVKEGYKLTTYDYVIEELHKAIKARDIWTQQKR